MGADIVGWRGCTLQRTAGPERFLGLLRLRSLKRLVEDRYPPATRSAILVTVEEHAGAEHRGQREIRYDALVDLLSGFESGSPDCRACPLAQGRALGCHRRVTYPIDAAFEELLFTFVRDDREDPAVAELVDGLLRGLPERGTVWHTERGPRPPSLVERRAPLVHTWTERGRHRRFDTAQLLLALFTPYEHPRRVLDHARFWSAFLGWVDTRRTAMLDALSADQPDALASFQRMLVASSSRTLDEVRSVATLLLLTVPGAVREGWTVEIDA